MRVLIVTWLVTVIVGLGTGFVVGPRHCIESRLPCMGPDARETRCSGSGDALHVHGAVIREFDDLSVAVGIGIVMGSIVLATAWGIRAGRREPFFVPEFDARSLIRERSGMIRGAPTGGVPPWPKRL
jgi:hypothetical protein